MAVQEHPPRVRVALKAMATRFEIVVASDDRIRARAAAEEAAREIKRIEGALSFFDPGSLVSRINREAARRPTAIPAPVFDLLKQARSLHEATDGAFDITVPPDTTGKPAGMSGVRLDEGTKTIRFERPGTAINLGGIGKGYAIDEAAAVLLDAGFLNALIHGGTSTACALGMDGDAPWTVAVSHPHPDRSDEILATMELHNRALSASGIYGRGKTRDGTWIGHIIDPRSGQNVQHTELAVVVTDSSTKADALSTALLVLGNPEAARAAFKNCDTLTHSATGCTQESGAWSFPTR